MQEKKQSIEWWKREMRENEERVPKSKRLALRRRSQICKAKVPTWFNTITMTFLSWSEPCLPFGSQLKQGPYPVHSCCIYEAAPMLLCLVATSTFRCPTLLICLLRVLLFQQFVFTSHAFLFIVMNISNLTSSDYIYFDGQITSILLEY